MHTRTPNRTASRPPRARRARPCRLRATLIEVPGTAAVLHLDGEIDYDQAPVLQDAVTRAAARRHPRLIIDLARVRFCDTTTLHILFKAQRAAEEYGAVLLLAEPSTVVRRVLEITEMDRVFAVRGSVRAALTDHAERERV
ncbi:STAS domain-containing protein [Streptomyces sp. TLI_171]|uniref:STAS domain-containing protein n=1 Tax=Streptomyces sp. TLI_171 TaxID=1938859 RepID=UPI000C1A7A07|nr:STAS domain-containing protein [Streptomyces sp. TLI_171]RKE23667.1 anti-anti-sigma factor [Streptomyces sp. TLI_171]